MINKLLAIILFIGTTVVYSQSVQIVAKINKSSIELKWYAPELILKEGVNIYRSIDSSNWVKLNNAPIKRFDYSFSSTDLNEDNELSDLKEILKNNTELEDLSKLILTLKSFKSLPLSKYLGIYYSDNDLELKPQTFYYRLENQSGKIFGVSKPIRFGAETASAKIDSIYYDQKRRGVTFGWKPDPLSYYGVNIYRSDSKDSIGALITKDPILVSKVKNQEGKSEYPRFFYSDEFLKEKHTYYYTLVGLDFFNQPTVPSEPIKIRIKDETLPAAPVHLRKVIYGKTVDLKWYKEEKEEDFREYKLYYKTPDDTLLKSLNTNSTLFFQDSSFKAENFDEGLYFITVAAVDEEGNEAFSNEVVVEILDLIPPGIPENVIVVSDSARLIVKWKANQEKDLLGYKIYRSIENDINNLSLLTAAPFKDNFFIDSLPKNAMNKFSYAVISLDTNLNESKLSALASNSMIDITAPREPFLKNIILENQKIRIEWVKNTELDLLGYNIFRKKLKDTAAIFEQVNHTLVPPDINMYFDRNYELGTEYVYRLIATDKAGNRSRPSNEFKLSVPREKKESTISVHFSKVKYARKINTLHLAWKYEQDFEEQEIAQKVLFRRVSGGEFKVLKYISHERKFSDSDLLSDKDMEYQIRIYDKEGNIYRSEIYKHKVSLKK